MLDGMVKVIAVRQGAPRLEADERHLEILVRAPHREIVEVGEVHRHTAAVLRAGNGRRAERQTLGHDRVVCKQLPGNRQPAVGQRNGNAVGGQHNVLVGYNAAERIRALKLHIVVGYLLAVLPAERVGVMTANLVIHHGIACILDDMLLFQRISVQRIAHGADEIPRIHLLRVLARREREFRTGAADFLRLPRQIASEAVLRDLIRPAVHGVGLVLEPSHDWEQNGRMAFPCRRIALPDVLRAVLFARKAGQLGTEFVNFHAKAFVFQYLHGFFLLYLRQYHIIKAAALYGNFVS